MFHQRFVDVYEVFESFNASTKQADTNLRTKDTARIFSYTIVHTLIASEKSPKKHFRSACLPAFRSYTFHLYPPSRALVHPIISCPPSILFFLTPTSRATRRGLPRADLTLRAQNALGDRTYPLEQVASSVRIRSICIRWGRLQHATDDTCPPTYYQYRMETAWSMKGSNHYLSERTLVLTQVPLSLLVLRHSR